MTALARSPGRTGHAWRVVQAQVWATETHCWLCALYVDQTLPPGHPKSRTADHLWQLQHGGPPTSRENLRLAHRACNTARGNRLRIPRHRCACTLGKPCAPLPPPTLRPLDVDPTTV